MTLGAKLKPGQYVLVTWLDYNTDARGELKDAKLTKRVDGGWFQRWGKQDGVDYLVVAITHDPDEETKWEGYSTYLAPGILSIEVVK